MYLSNKGLVTIIILCGIGLADSCGSKDTATNSRSNVAANGELTKGEQTFASKEPDVYQTEVYYSSGGTSDKYFVARNGNARRFDTYVKDQLSVTELIKDNNRYVVDHVRKMYYVEPPSDKGPKVVNPAALAFFQNTQHHEFEEIGRDNSTITYRAKKLQGDPDQEVVLMIDQKTGLMVHQEVKGADAKNSYTFDLKNVKQEASDDLFQLPAGYKQVTKDEFNPPMKNTNAAAAPLSDKLKTEIKKAHD
ncbi:MAG: hypothetical protein ACJ73D_02185 [Pyrinomonadaceae bacterium]